jgi:hypothetical protein
VDELLEDISVDDLRESLPSHQPRYVIYSYKMEHNDGRISYPMCFIYITPRGKVTCVNFFKACNVKRGKCLFFDVPRVIMNYRLCFKFPDSQIELQIMYAGTKMALQREADLTRVYEIRELEELTEEWLQEKLGK